MLQTDLTKISPQYVWMVYDEDEHGEGRWQAIQYERVIEYYSYYKHHGNIVISCITKK